MSGEYRVLIGPIGAEREFVRSTSAEVVVRRARRVRARGGRAVVQSRPQRGRGRWETLCIMRRLGRGVLLDVEP